MAEGKGEDNVNVGDGVGAGDGSVGDGVGGGNVGEGVGEGVDSVGDGVGEGVGDVGDGVGGGNCNVGDGVGEGVSSVDASSTVKVVETVGMSIAAENGSASIAELSSSESHSSKVTCSSNSASDLLRPFP